MLSLAKFARVKTVMAIQKKKKKKTQFLANKFKRMTRCRDIPAKRFKAVYRSHLIRA